MIQYVLKMSGAPDTTLNISNMTFSVIKSQSRYACLVLVVMTLRNWAQARGAPILAEYLGGAVTCDAYHMTDPRADGLGVSTCIELALKNAGIERDEVWLERLPCLVLGSHVIH